MLRRHLLINKMALMLHEKVPAANIHIVCVLSIARAITAIVVIGTRTAVVSTVCSRLVAVSVVVVSTVVVVLRAANELRRLELFEEVSLLAPLAASACRVRFVVVRQTVDVHEEVG